MPSQKCQRLRFEHPFTCLSIGMTVSRKTAWVLSLLQQWQPAYTEMLVAMPLTEFVKGIPTALEQDSYFDVNKQNLTVFS